MDLVHHLGDDADVSRLVGDDHRGVLGPLDVHAFHQRAHVAQVHLPAVHPDVAVLAHGDQDVAGLLVLHRVGVGTADHDTGFLHERCGDDEEDQQVQHEVEHRCQIDAVLAAVLLVVTCLHLPIPSC